MLSFELWVLSFELSASRPSENVAIGVFAVLCGIGGVFAAAGGVFVPAKTVFVPACALNVPAKTLFVAVFALISGEKIVFVAACALISGTKTVFVPAKTLPAAARALRSGAKTAPTVASVTTPFGSDIDAVGCSFAFAVVRLRVQTKGIHHGVTEARRGEERKAVKGKAAKQQSGKTSDRTPPPLAF
ncbi:MAG: hypothetical protein IBJ18_08065 [Phycisphaerales bacterium]|nr:hypothetical protein [Phycisphaerales bacterium]